MTPRQWWGKWWGTRHLAVRQADALDFLARLHTLHLDAVSLGFTQAAATLQAAAVDATNELHTVCWPEGTE